MNSKLELKVLPQPDDVTCGPTCLHAVYRHFGLDPTLDEVIREVRSLKHGGTLAAYLGLHALGLGFRATLYTYNLRIFDPTWFPARPAVLRAKLIEQLNHKKGGRFKQATRAYLEFLKRRGRVRMRDMTPSLLRKFLKREVPVLTGLSATYLYNCAREIDVDGKLIYDDMRGEPTGHFVLLAGYDRSTQNVWVADPLRPNPMSESGEYPVPINRLVCAIMLGIITYDANLLILEPRKRDESHG